VVVLLKMPGDFQRRLPDGLEGLADHNLLTYKSMHEPLDDWALKELVGHYVNYRKQVGLSMNDLMPESQFKLYAVRIWSTTSSVFGSSELGCNARRKSRSVA